MITAMLWTDGISAVIHIVQYTVHGEEVGEVPITIIAL